jgi:replicative DNA helicase
MIDALTMDLPWSREAECGLVGALLQDNALLDQVGDIVRADYFHDPAVSRVYAAIEQMVNAGKMADVITVWERLKESGLDEGIELAWIGSLTIAAGTPRIVRRYAELIAEKALSRRFVTASTEVYELAQDAGPVQDRIGAAQSKLEKLQESTVKSQPQPIQNFVAGMLDRVQALADGKVEPGIPTRIPGLDRILGGGLKPGKQMILAARPSVGKSSLAEQLCINLAMHGHAAAMFSQEMTCQEMADRATSTIGRIDMERLQTGKLEDSDYSRLVDAIERMRTLPLFFDEQPALTLQDIAAKARALKRKHDIKLLVIDYIQLCGTTQPKLSRHHQLEEISRGLKSLAKQLEITILTLSQLNREVEKRATGRPVMSDLKESGAIEEDADVVMMMWRHQQGEHANVIGMEVPKNRQGKTGELALHFEGAVQRWGQSTESLDAPKKQSSYGRDL